MSEITLPGRADVPAHVETEHRDDTVIRAMDVTIVTLALIFLLPLMVIIAVAVFLQDGGPVLFSHRRVGRDGRPFYCLKFRSMTIGAEARLAALLASSPAARAEWARDRKLGIDPRRTPLRAVRRRSTREPLPPW